MHQEAAGQGNPRLGYVFGLAAARISGVSVFVNSLGVRAFADPVLYTALKDGLVGLILLVPLCFAPGWRSECRRLDAKTWMWLIALALKERLHATVWTGLLVLLIGTVLGTNLATLRWNSGSVLIAVSTVLFRQRLSSSLRAETSSLHPRTTLGWQ
jgi:uncharacterized membrane protein